MNCYNIILFCFISLFTFQNKQFVEFKNDEVKITAKGEQLTIVLPFEILQSFHIQSEKVVDNNLIPTEIHFYDSDGYKILSYQFSKTNRENLFLDQLKCEVLSDNLEVTLRLEKKKTLEKDINLNGYLYYQACDDRQCFYPRSLSFSLKLSN